MRHLTILLTLILSGCVTTTDLMMKHNKLHCNGEGFETYYDLDNRISFTCDGGQDFYIKR